MLTSAEISYRLTNAPILADHRNLHPSFFEEPPRLAAVLIPIMQVNEPVPSWHVVFTRRTETVADHKGQVAFPGGRVDNGDEFPFGTALREANEEIGINPSDVTILGRMESLMTISNYLVTPVIGEIPWDYPFTPQPDEVSRIFTIPLDWLAQDDHIEVHHRSVVFPTSNQAQPLRVVYFKEYEQEIVWGISAEITLRLLVKLGMLSMKD